MTLPESSAEATTAGRRAEVAAREGEALGACLYLTAAELAALDVDVKEAEEIAYEVDEDTRQLQIEAVDGGSDR